MCRQPMQADWVKVSCKTFDMWTVAHAKFEYLHDHSFLHIQTRLLEGTSVFFTSVLTFCIHEFCFAFSWVISIDKQSIFVWTKANIIMCVFEIEGWTIIVQVHYFWTYLHLSPLIWNTFTRNWKFYITNMIHN